jgi:tetratricopeptide (TPR) repeat protein
MPNSNNININYIINTILCVFLIGTSLSLEAQNQNDIQLANEYLLKGEKQKALEIYRDLARADVNTPFIHNNYFNTLLDLGENDEAQNYIKRLQRKDPENIQYKVDAGIIYVRSGDLARADKYFKDLINSNRSNISRIKLIADYLSSKSLSDYSILALTESRQAIGNSYLFSLELAMLYRIKGEKDKMVVEYLNYVTQSSANIQYVKNVMQALLTKPDELESLEKILYERIQKSPDVEVYSDLLIWVTLQQKNFYASFIQSRAYDRRYKKSGERSMEVARVALDNEDYENALRCYQYVAKEYPEGPYFLQARLGIIKAREARIRNSFPVKADSVKKLITEYRRFVTEYNNNTNAHEAQRNEALLYANYLGETDKAIELLKNLIDNPRVSLQIRSKSKLDLGDIYIITGESWESSLLYSQVEKALKESPLGYEAKLKNAKLLYYRGNFKLAQEHLDILKLATTREIANDAMELSLLIKENLAIDTLGEALKIYASVELLLNQNKDKEALRRIQGLKQGRLKLSAEDSELIHLPVTGTDSMLHTFSNYAILDDVYMLEANLRIKRGEFENALTLLHQVLTEYPEDVLADDAYFLQGEIYEKHLNDRDKAMDVYREFLNRFPGSVYAFEARKRYRILRGDFVDQPQL